MLKLNRALEVSSQLPSSPVTPERTMAIEISQRVKKDNPARWLTLYEHTLFNSPGSYPCFLRQGGYWILEMKWSPPRRCQTMGQNQPPFLFSFFFSPSFYSLTFKGGVCGEHFQIKLHFFTCTFNVMGYHWGKKFRTNFWQIWQILDSNPAGKTRNICPNWFFFSTWGYKSLPFEWGYRRVGDSESATACISQCAAGRGFHPSPPPPAVAAGPCQDGGSAGHRHVRPWQSVCKKKYNFLKIL